MDEERIAQMKQVREIFQSCVISRGGIIDITIDIENIVTDIIAWCFFPTPGRLHDDIDNQLDENGVLLKSSILRILEFQEKIERFEDVISTKYPEVWSENRQLIKHIRKSLDEVRKFRNLLAHSPLDTSKQGIELLRSCSETGKYSFQILDYKKGKVRKHVINSERLESEVLDMHKVYYRLLQLWALLKNDREDAKACDTISNLSKEEQKRLLAQYGFSED